MPTFITNVAGKSRFSQKQEIGNITIIADFEFQYIYYFLLYVYHMMLVNMIVYICGMVPTFPDRQNSSTFPVFFSPLFFQYFFNVLFF